MGREEKRRREEDKRKGNRREEEKREEKKKKIRQEGRENVKGKEKIVSRKTAETSKQFRKQQYTSTHGKIICQRFLFTRFLAHVREKRRALKAHVKRGGGGGGGGGGRPAGS